MSTETVAVHAPRALAVREHYLLNLPFTFTPAHTVPGGIVSPFCFIMR